MNELPSRERLEDIVKRYAVVKDLDMPVQVSSLDVKLFYDIAQAFLSISEDAPAEKVCHCFNGNRNLGACYCHADAINDIRHMMLLWAVKKIGEKDKEVTSLSVHYTGAIDMLNQQNKQIEELREALERASTHLH